MAAQDASGAHASCLALQEAAIRHGSVPPIAIDLDNGRRLAFRCIVTQDGGRMLTYTDITRTTRERQLQHAARDAADRLDADLRAGSQNLASQAACLAVLAGAADDAARTAELAARRLEQEISARLGREAELRRQASTDALTGALNRSHLLLRGQVELERVRRVGQDLAVVMLNIDHFKAINDRHGHATGDAALKQVVDRLARGMRHIDVLGRVGGEEFAIVLPAIALPGALVVCERLRAAIAAEPMRHAGRTLSLTASLGLAMAEAGDHALDQVLARADAALYRAKHTGRNRVCWGGEAKPPGLPRAAEPHHAAGQPLPV